MQIADQNLPAGERIGHLIIESVLGMGGFGVTYKALDPDLEKYFAVKEYLPAELSVRDSHSKSLQPRTGRVDDFKYGLERFLDEAKTLAKFNHANICQVTQYVQTNSTAYLIMNYEQGEALDDYLKRINFQGHMPELEILSIIKPILAGLAAVHKEGLLHRDIKPGNIYLRQNGEPMLIDFGAARYALGEQSKSISAIVSMGYAPPEQYTSRGKQGAWTDLYAIGAVIYCLMTGKQPIESPDRREAMANDEADPLVPASQVGAGRYSKQLLEAVDWCLNLSYKQRPQSAASLLSALETGIEAADASPEVATVNSTGTRRVSKEQRFDNEPKADAVAGPKFIQRLKPILAVMLVLALAYGAFSFWQHWVVQQEKDAQAWQQAQSRNERDAYQRYLDEWPTGNYSEQANARLQSIKLQQQQAAQQQKNLVYKAQGLMSKLGFQLSRTGELDDATQRAIADFERQQKLAVTGEADERLLQHLQQAYQILDRRAWERAKRNNTTAGYQRYQQDHPGGEFLHLVKPQLQGIQQAKQLAEQAADDKRKLLDQQQWRQADSVGTIAAYRRYLQQQPGGQYRSRTESIITELERLNSQRLTTLKKQWQRVEATRDIAQLRVFIRDYKDSPHIADAQALLDRLQYGEYKNAGVVKRVDRQKNLIRISPEVKMQLSSGKKVYIKVSGKMQEFRVSRRLGADLLLISFADVFPRVGDTVLVK